MYNRVILITQIGNIMKNLNWALAVTGIAFVGLLYGILSLNYDRYETKADRVLYVDDNSLTVHAFTKNKTYVYLSYLLPEPLTDAQKEFASKNAADRISNMTIGEVGDMMGNKEDARKFFESCIVSYKESFSRIIKFDVYAKDANNIPVEITVLGQQGNYPNADYLMKKAAHQYASERMTEEILLDHSDGTIRMSFYIPTMPFN